MHMKKIERTSELLWLFGILFVACGVALCSKADLGVSMIAAPAFILGEALAPLWSGFSVGVIEYLIQGILLVLLCALLRRFDWRFLLAFAVAVLYGYTLNLFLFLFRSLLLSAVWHRWIALAAGDLCVAFGVACFFRTYLPLQAYELFVAEVSARFGFGVNKTKWVFDLSLLALSLALAFTLFGDAGSFDWSSVFGASYHSIGLGTLVTTAINSPLISLCGKCIDRFFLPTPLCPSLERILGRKRKGTPSVG